jgi:hypothetical protein
MCAVFQWRFVFHLSNKLYPEVHCVVPEITRVAVSGKEKVYHKLNKFIFPLLFDCT